MGPLTMQAFDTDSQSTTTPMRCSAAPCVTAPASAAAFARAATAPASAVAQLGVVGVATRLVRTVLLIFLSSTLLALSPPAEMTYEDKLVLRWSVIEPLVFIRGGSNYVGAEVCLYSATVTVFQPLVVKTSAGTTAHVSDIPKADMDFLRQLANPDTKMTILGTITAIDPRARTISIKASKIRPEK